MPIRRLCYRWDHYLLERIPEHIKICFLGLYNLVNHIAEEGCKRLGRDVLGYIRHFVRTMFTILMLDTFFLFSTKIQ